MFVPYNRMVDLGSMPCGKPHLPHLLLESMDVTDLGLNLTAPYLPLFISSNGFVSTNAQHPVRRAPLWHS